MTNPAGLIPYLTVDDPVAALDFYARAFGATETLRLKMGDKVGRAEMTLAGARFMLAGEWPQMGILSPKSRGGATAGFSIMVADADAAFARAVEAGASVQRPPSDEFYGDRVGHVIDPFGHRWSLHEHRADYAPEELQRRMDEAMARMSSGDAADAAPTRTDPTEAEAEAEAEAHPS